MGGIKKIYGKIEHRERLGYLMVAPSSIVVLLLLLYPIILTLWYSVNAFKGLRTGFVGLENYLDIFTDPEFLSSSVTTTCYVIFSVLFQLAIGIPIALLLRGSTHLSRLVRTGILVPWTMSQVAVGMMWQYMFSAVFGIINDVLLKLHIIEQGIDWLTLYPLQSVISVEVWVGLTFVILFTLAGLQTIPQDLYDAANIDGAGVFNTLRYVTLPLLKPILLVIMLFQTINALRAYTVVWVLTRGGPAGKTEIISLFAYNELFSYHNYGRGAAAVTILTVFCAFVSIIYVWQIFKSAEI